MFEFRKSATTFFLMLIFVTALVPERASALGCPSCAVELPIIDTNTAITAGVQANRAAGNTVWQWWQKIKSIMSELQAADRTLVTLEDMYYMIQAFAYLHDNGGILGALSMVSEGASMASGIAAQGLSFYQGLAASSGGSLYTLSPQQYSDAIGGIAQFGAMSGALSSSAQTLSMISNENSGVPFLEVVNGAQLGVQAALTTTSAVNNLGTWFETKDQMATFEAMKSNVEATQQKESSAPLEMTVPCLNRPAYISTYQTNRFVNGQVCETVRAPSIVVPKGPVNSGLNQQQQQYTQNVCLQSQASIQMGGQTPPNCNIPPPPQNPPIPISGGPPATVGPVGVQPGQVNNTGLAQMFQAGTGGF